MLRLEPPAGLQAQVDFAEFRLPWYALMLALGISRSLWLKLYPRQAKALLMADLEEAFAAFAGVPRELLIDQLKTIIIVDQRTSCGKLLENPQFHWWRSWHPRMPAISPSRHSG